MELIQLLNAGTQQCKPILTLLFGYFIVPHRCSFSNDVLRAVSKSAVVIASVLIEEEQPRVVISESSWQYDASFRQFLFLNSFTSSEEFFIQFECR